MRSGEALMVPRPGVVDVLVELNIVLAQFLGLDRYANRCSLLKSFTDGVCSSDRNRVSLEIGA